MYNQSNDNMSGNDVKQLYYYLMTLVRGSNKDIFEDSGFSVLELLREYLERVLVQVQGEPVCKYERLLTWRMTTAKLNEDTFTTAFLAIEDLEKAWSQRTHFDWRTVIGHNNYELNNLLKKGTVENHYHLKGSAPYFSITWLNLMNDINNEKFIKYLREFDEHKLARGLPSHQNGMEVSYVERHLKAALIRCYLYSCLKRIPFRLFEKYELNTYEIDTYINWEKNDKIISKEAVQNALSTMEKKGYSKIGFQSFIQNIFKEYDWDFEKDLFWSIITRCISEEHCFEIDEIRNYFEKKDVNAKNIAEYFFNKMHLIHIFETDVSYIIKPGLQKKFVRECGLAMVQYFLNEQGAIHAVRDDLQRFINQFHINNRIEYKNVVDGSDLVHDYIDASDLRHDYIDDYSWKEKEEEEYKNINRTERWFLYSMFQKLYGGDAEFLALGNLFYAYLILKENIRSELVQVNTKTGFDNFLKYQDRKEYFIDNTRYENLYTRIALEDTWYYQRETLDRLEARISPKDTADANRRAIKKILKVLDGIEIAKNKTFFVFHFVKEPDRDLVSDIQQCRHHKKRIEVKQKAIAIERFRQKYPKEAAYVYGIDACSPEIGCRPEVFAQAFTYLRGMQESGIRHGAVVPRFGISYHVGEDFLDIVDGLRAIDEAIHYLHMESGDRLGHALALGINPIEWYGFKGNRVLLTKQDHLDNIVWIYMKIRKYSICCSEGLLQELHRDYIHCYQELYKGTETNKECDINVYYDAWKLRGDNPELYLTDETDTWISETEWDYFGRNGCYLENKKIRESKECRKLYGRYHFDTEVKRIGAEVIECKVNRELIEVVNKIQKELQKEIAGRGISIEANPSSNYMIGTFSRYDQHPIRNFYNKGLTVNIEELMGNPQIDVTINTDDQAVFSTNLENEYAYMALALEKMRDGNGKKIYKRSMIYEWLDNIRKNGKKVCFLQGEVDK